MFRGRRKAPTVQSLKACSVRIIFGINRQRQETFSGNESTFLGEQSTFLGWETTFLGSNIKKSAFLEAGSWVAVLSVFSRLSVGKIKQGIREEKRTAILIKSTFSILAFFGRSQVLLWFVLGLQPEGYWGGTTG